MFSLRNSAVILNFKHAIYAERLAEFQALENGKALQNIKIIIVQRPGSQAITMRTKSTLSTFVFKTLIDKAKVS